MNKKQMMKSIEDAIKRVEKEIANNREGGIFAKGLASEGYQGGYRDALSDCILLINGAYPRRRGWWENNDPDYHGEGVA